MNTPEVIKLKDIITSLGDTIARTNEKNNIQK
jgi:calcineurin-like phosphoesterase family protein